MWRGRFKMALGDGIRRNISTVSEEEKIRFRNAILKIHTDKFYPDGVSYWFKQDQIHQATHVHGGPAFLPWHRNLINKYEQLLREVDPEISLHYWDWTENAESINLLGPNGLMSVSSGLLQSPFDILHNNGEFNGSRDQTQNPVDPPQRVTRNFRFNPLAEDDLIVNVADQFGEVKQWNRFRIELEDWHDACHGVIGGNIGGLHQAFEDSFVFLIHSNVDRLWAKWQLKPGKEWRLDPERIYGMESNHAHLNEIMEPWGGGVTDPTQKIRPWGSDVPAEKTTAKDVSIVTNVPKYDK
jgi:Common central domain of tyrosinase